MEGKVEYMKAMGRNPGMVVLVWSQEAKDCSDSPFMQSTACN